MVLPADLRSRGRHQRPVDFVTVTVPEDEESLSAVQNGAVSSNTP